MQIKKVTRNKESLKLNIKFTYKKIRQHNDTNSINKIIIKVNIQHLSKKNS